MPVSMKFAIPVAAAASLCAALAMVPASAQTEAQANAQGALPLKQCVRSLGMQTQILDPNTILATGTGRGGVVLDVKGCRLHPRDVLVMEYRGSNQICGPMDVQLSVRQSGSGITAPCFIQSVKAVTQEEAKALSSKKYERTAG